MYVFCSVVKFFQRPIGLILADPSRMLFAKWSALSEKVSQLSHPVLSKIKLMHQVISAPIRIFLPISSHLFFLPWSCGGWLVALFIIFMNTNPKLLRLNLLPKIYTQYYFSLLIKICQNLLISSVRLHLLTLWPLIQSLLLLKQSIQSYGVSLTSLFFFLYAVIAGKIDKWVWIGLSLYLFEAIVLLSFKMKCPLTLITRRYSNSGKHNFDIYLPNWLAKHNLKIYISILLIIILILVTGWHFFPGSSASRCLAQVVIIEH